MHTEGQSGPNPNKGKVLQPREGVQVTLGNPIGSGGYATVYEATWTEGGISHTVAVKRLHAGLMENPKVVAGFTDEFYLLQARQREVEIARAADSASQNSWNYHHPRVFDFGSDSDGLYIVMEYIEGENLGDVLKKQHDKKGPPFTPEQTVSLMYQAFDAVIDAETASRHTGRDSLVIWDFRSTNIILTPEGELRITDLGNAMMQREVAEITYGSPTGGAPGYLAPEQLEQLLHTPDGSVTYGPLPSARTNVYQLGLLLYELVMGERITDLLQRIGFATELDIDIAITQGEMHKHIIYALESRGNAMSDQVKDLIIIATDPNPDNRYASAFEFMGKFAHAVGDARYR